MSDISIPGVTSSKYKTDELIAGLMRVEKIPRDRAETELSTYKTEQAAWRQINQLSATLRDTSKSLYSFSNPFNEKLGTSTNERAVTASVTRDAKDQSLKISVTQVAESDRFLSSEVSKDAKVPKGDYTFVIGENTINLSWKGGSYREFAESINRRSEGILRATLIQTTSTSQALLLESQKTGSTNRLTFEKDAKDFALQSGIIKKNDSNVIETSVTQLQLLPKTNTKIDFSEVVRAKNEYMLEYSVSIISMDSSFDENADSESQKIPDSGSLTFGGITIENAPADIVLSKGVPTSPPPPVKDLSVLSLRTVHNLAIPLPELTDSTEKQLISIPLSEYGDINALLTKNNNTHKIIELSNIRIFDPKAAGEYSPVNPVSTAQDAIIRYEGISITRSTNEISDLIPGVTLNLHEKTTTAETIQIKPDVERIKEEIITFVANYNRLIAEINILTQTKPEVISELLYFTVDERKEAEEKLGMMQGDTTLNGLKNTLQRISANSYPTGIKDTTMFSQIGISTKSSAGGLEANRLRGYLEIDEKKLDEALNKNILGIKTLFGFDTDKDLVIDAGIAHAIDNHLTPFVQTGGIFSLRTNGLTSKITTTEKKIAQLDIQLQSKEQDLKRKYGQMEGTLNSLQNQSNSISNFNKQNSN